MSTKTNVSQPPGLGNPLFAPTGSGSTQGEQMAISAPPQSLRVMVAALQEPLLAVAVLLGLQQAMDEPMNRAVALLSIMTMLLLFPGTSRFHDTFLNAATDTLAAWGAVVAVLLLCGFATDSFKFFNHEVLIGWAVLTPAAQLAATRLGRRVIQARLANPELRRAALVVGAGAVGARTAQVLRNRSEQGVDFVGYLEDRDLTRCADGTGPHIVGRLDDLATVVRQLQVKDVYITLPLSVQPRIARLLRELHDTAVSIFYVPDLAGINAVQGRMRTLDGMPVVSLLESPFVGINGLVKRVSDVVLGSVITVLILPLMAAVAIGVKMSSPGPIVFKQRRNGLDGKEITVYKFRSMRTMDNGAVVKQATRGDPRITPFGAFIRRTSLDELPQFINVLQGRMSIVGPRPHAVAHNEQYRQIIDAYMVRHKVKPGITGWAQVNGHRGETDVIEKMQARVEHDIDYLRNWSLTMDLRIVARTLKLVLFDRQAY